MFRKRTCFKRGHTHDNIEINDFIFSHEQNQPLRHNQDICVPQGPHHHQAPGCALTWTSKHPAMEDYWKYGRRQVPPTIQEKQPEHPLSQDKPPIQEIIIDNLDGKCNHLLPMVVEVVAPGVEIVSQGCLWEWLLNVRSVLEVAPLGEHVFAAKHTRWNSFPPSCQLPRSASELLPSKNILAKNMYLNRSYGPVKSCGLQVKKDNSWTSALPALMKLLAPAVSWHISGRKTEKD